MGHRAGVDFLEKEKKFGSAGMRMPDRKTCTLGSKPTTLASQISRRKFKII